MIDGIVNLVLSGYLKTNISIVYHIFYYTEVHIAHKLRLLNNKIVMEL